eukprot:3556493-Pyramimonas_sp.AAC.1
MVGYTAGQLGRPHKSCGELKFPVAERLIKGLNATWGPTCRRNSFSSSNRATRAAPARQMAIGLILVFHPNARSETFFGEAGSLFRLGNSLIRAQWPCRTLPVRSLFARSA